MTIQINATKKFNYTAIKDRLRPVSLSNYSDSTGGVNRFTGPIFQLPATVVQSKGRTFKKIVNKPPYIDNKPIATSTGEVINIDAHTA